MLPDAFFSFTAIANGPVYHVLADRVMGADGWKKPLFIRYDHALHLHALWIRAPRAIHVTALEMVDQAVPISVLRIIKTLLEYLHLLPFQMEQILIVAVQFPIYLSLIHS